MAIPTAEPVCRGATHYGSIVRITVLILLGVICVCSDTDTTAWTLGRKTVKFVKLLTNLTILAVKLLTAQLQFWLANGY